jgi:hypothetical protein
MRFFKTWIGSTSLNNNKSYLVRPHQQTLSITKFSTSTPLAKILKKIITLKGLNKIPLNFLKLKKKEPRLSTFMRF